MKIQQLKINNYGKIKDKEINCGNHINILYGKNESGKSTILKYIVSSLYGISKNKKGKEYSDFEKYEPWIGEDFSGKLTYQLDNGEKYEIYRDFRKKNPKIFNEKMEDISKQFTIDKTTGNSFFYDQTKVDEQLFLTTFVSNQQETQLQKNEQGMLIQKIANIVGTGEDNVSYKTAIDRINRRQLEEVGTSRSREKPINIINNKIGELEQEKADLQKYQEMQYMTEEKERQIVAEVEQFEYELTVLKELKILYEEQTKEKEKLLLKENIKKQNIENIREIDSQVEKIHMENKEILEKYETRQNILRDIEDYEEKEDNVNEIKKRHKRNKSTLITIICIIIVNILQFILLKNSIAKYIIFSLSVAIIVLLIGIRYKNQKEQKQKEKTKQQEKEKSKIAKELAQKEELQKYEILKEKIKLLENEIQILEKNNNEIQEEMKKYQDDIKRRFEEKKLAIIEKYKQISINQIEEVTENNIQYKIQDIQNNINNKKIELHSIELDKNNILPKIETLAQIEEQYANCYEQKHELEKLNTAINFAKQLLEECYEKMRHTVTPKFTQNLSRNMEKITNGKYTNISFHDENGLIVENENGQYVPASKLSIGTIEQLYLSLRLSMVDDLSKEKLPIILDETFAYFDDERLKNFLLYIDEVYENEQIFILTSTYREQQILDENQIKYNLVYIN